MKDLCRIECKGNYTVTLYMQEESTIADAKVNEDKQSVFVGSTAGTVVVYIVARGDNAETTDAQVQITVN